MAAWEYLRTGSADATPTSLLTPQSRDIDSASIEIRLRWAKPPTPDRRRHRVSNLELVGRFDE